MRCQADLGVWPGGIGSFGVDAAQEVTVLEPRLEGGSILALDALWSSCQRTMAAVTQTNMKQTACYPLRYDARTYSR
jgi:hypothetical protein